ncbi:Gfo/Idh/MocA family protein [Streptomyces sp. NPDC102360]|uniref:Gfo/Idh/MocA family protein n=1 Tax=Streptomyces sp. NPDC102360 TaxID=3366160 RepID=UPI003819205D
MTHRIIDCGADKPLRVVVAGAGNMGRAWLSAITAAPEADVVGLVDLDLDAARGAAADLGRPGLPIGSDVVALAAETGAQAVVDVTVPAAHHPVTTAALFAGLPVLGEKPAADTVAHALSLAAAAEASGELFMVSQSRRWNPRLFALREMACELGALATLTTEFFKAPHFGGFREQMAHPLLVDMAIHAFDSARFLLDADPVAVYCQAYNPPWSWFKGDAAAHAVFEMDGGIRYAYDGSWCSPGAETSWNGRWRLSGERGSALWNGEDDPVLDAEPQPPATRPHSTYSDITGALQVFVEALRTGRNPMGEVHENVMSLAMVDSAVRSADDGRRVLVDDVLNRAHTDALRAESHPEVRAALAAWPSVRAALTAHPPVFPTS